MEVSQEIPTVPETLTSPPPVEKKSEKRRARVDVCFFNEISLNLIFNF